MSSSCATLSRLYMREKARDSIDIINSHQSEDKAQSCLFSQELFGPVNFAYFCDVLLKTL